MLKMDARYTPLGRAAYRNQYSEHSASVLSGLFQGPCGYCSRKIDSAYATLRNLKGRPLCGFLKEDLRNEIGGCEGGPVGD